MSSQVRQQRLQSRQLITRLATTVTAIVPTHATMGRIAKHRPNPPVVFTPGMLGTVQGLRS
jgi:hypothetical protein